MPIKPKNFNLDFNLGRIAGGERKTETINYTEYVVIPAEPAHPEWGVADWRPPLDVNDPEIVREREVAELQRLVREQRAEWLAENDDPYPTPEDGFLASIVDARTAAQVNRQEFAQGGPVPRGGYYGDRMVDLVAEPEQVVALDQRRRPYPELGVIGFFGDVERIRQDAAQAAQQRQDDIEDELDDVWPDIDEDDEPVADHVFTIDLFDEDGERAEMLSDLEAQIIDHCRTLGHSLWALCHDDPQGGNNPALRRHLEALDDIENAVLANLAARIDNHNFAYFGEL